MSIYLVQIPNSWA